MKLRLKELRKAAGYSNRDDFAAACGIPAPTYKSWETGTRNIKLADAVAIADFLGCTLDELAGREGYVGKFADERQTNMNEDYSVLSEPGKDSAAYSVHGIRLGEERQTQAEAPPDQGRQGIA